MAWFAYALISGAAARATAILAKLGVEGVPSTLATAIRTIVVTVFAWAMVFGIDQQRAIPTLSRRILVFLALSGVATGVSWLAYFRALQMAPASWVAPIDKPMWNRRTAQALAHCSMSSGSWASSFNCQGRLCRCGHGRLSFAGLAAKDNGRPPPLTRQEVET